MKHATLTQKQILMDYTTRVVCREEKEPEMEGSGILKRRNLQRKKSKKRQKKKKYCVVNLQFRFYQRHINGANKFGGKNRSPQKSHGGKQGKVKSRAVTQTHRRSLQASAGRQQNQEALSLLRRKTGHPAPARHFDEFDETAITAMLGPPLVPVGQGNKASEPLAASSAATASRGQRPSVGLVTHVSGLVDMVGLVAHVLGMATEYCETSWDLHA
jgi:hypothetical protein